MKYSERGFRVVHRQRIHQHALDASNFNRLFSRKSLCEQVELLNPKKKKGC